jgi:hypothetical protein
MLLEYTLLGGNGKVESGTHSWIEKKRSVFLLQVQMAY